MKAKQVVFCYIVTAAFLLFGVNSAWASVGFSTVSIVPENPAISDLVKTKATGWIGYVIDEFFLGAEVNRTGTSVYANYYFVNTNPGGIGLPIAGGWDSTDIIGYLPAGEYTLYSKTWLTTNPYIIDEYLSGDEIDFLNGYFQMTDYRTTSFQVVPEPSMLLLFGVSVCIYRRLKK